MSDQLRKRIEQLERILFKPSVDWGQTYDTVKEMHRLTGHNEMPEEEQTRIFEKRYGTREEFIRMKKEGLR